ncbi:MAG TPA: ABC transporter permease [Candidatus Sulfomarinibacteraceae bacterium]|nr:ABC transporter permease [Candidatus Sulfomarinibacteraceae bacterium]
MALPRRIATGAARPDAPSDVAAAGRVFEHRAYQYRRVFRGSLFGSFVNPVLFLLAMGVGLGSYVNAENPDAFGGVTYLQFLAPGLLAGTVMQNAIFEATFPVMHGLVWRRVFHAMHATPISPRAVALGNLLWIAFRLALVAAIFVAVAAAFGALTSPLAVFAIPTAVLTGLAFAGPMGAYMATQRTPDSFSAIFRWLITPLYLFSGTFFPISSLPGALQPIAWLSPLWHGVELTRGFALGTVGTDPLAAVVHIVVLGGIGLGGAVLFERNLRRRLAA